MKKTFLTTLVLLFSFAAFSQEGTTKKDTASFKLGNMKLLLFADDSDTTSNKPAKEEKRKRSDGHWGGIDLGINLLTNENFDPSLPGSLRNWENEPLKSLNWNLNLAEFTVPLTRDKNTLSVVTGLGVSFRSFSFQKRNLDLKSDNDETTLEVNPDQTYAKRKFRISYLTAPLLINLNTNADKDRNFHIGAGVIGYLRLGSLYKQKYDDDEGDEQKIKTRDDFNLNPFRADATVRVGYQNFTFFAQMGLTPLFRTGRGPELYPLTFGVQLIPF